MIAPHYTANMYGRPYLKRWHLLPRNNWFAVYLHKFEQSDGQVFHDHPYDNISIVIRGFYREHNRQGSRIVRRFRPVFRRAEDPHRVELIADRPAWSLFVCLRRRREWGFHCPQGWKHWREFVNLETNSNTDGPGCG